MDKESEFEMVIQRHLGRVHKLRAIQQMIDEDPALVPELLEILTARASLPTGPPRQPEVRRRVDSRTQSQKVLDFFKTNGNTPASVRDIAQATGLSKNIINALVYTSPQKDLFFRVHVGPKRVLWRLRDEADGADTEGVVDDPEVAAEHEEIRKKEQEPDEANENR